MPYDPWQIYSKLSKYEIPASGINVFNYDFLQALDNNMIFNRFYAIHTFVTDGNFWLTTVSIAEQSQSNSPKDII